MQKLLLLDGNSILNRAYYAIPPLNDKQGKNVNAVYGFVNILLKVVADYNPDRLVVAFDKHGHNFRKDLYADYKANRKGMPDDLAAQMPILHDLLQTMKVAIVEKGGVEADDIIGTISSNFDGESLIVSGDKDMFQLVSDKCTVLHTKRGVTDIEHVDLQHLKTQYQMEPYQVIEYKALRGDTSDNIPGVKGVGEKTAMQLLEKYGNIDVLFDHLDEQKGALLQKLTDGKNDAYVSKQLATIVTNADIDYNFDVFNLPTFDGKVKSMMENLQFRSIISRLDFGEVVEEVVQVETITIDTLDALQKVAKQLQDSQYVAFHWMEECVYLSNSSTLEYKIVMSQSFLDELTEQVVFENVKDLLESSVPKAVFDSKSLRHKLHDIGVEIASVKYDLSLMQYLVEYRSHKDVASLCDAYGYAQIGAGIFALAKTLQEELEKIGVTSLYYDVELPLADLLYRMEKEGVRVDMDLLKTMSVDLNAQVEKLASVVCEYAGEPINVNSPKQLSHILFEKLQLPHGKKMQSGYSTNNEVLEKIADKHPIVPAILEYRKLSKLLGTYVDGLKSLVKHGLVHTTFNQSLTTTGRLSSSDPNLQNIPVRNEMGREIRKLFCSKYGTFVGADYSQIELRLLAAFSQDENLLNSFLRGEDIHTSVASELLGLPAEEVTADMRRIAKAVNFGIIYGISDFGLSQNTKISVYQAREYIETYFARFPKIKAYLDGTVEEARKTGYVKTLTGRRRYIPEINSSNFNLRSFGERAAMNMPLQGSAADIMKIAMLKVDQAMQKAGLKSKIVLQIHDELIVDCYPEEAQQVKQIVKQQMEEAVSLACPLIANTEEGVNLYEA